MIELLASATSNFAEDTRLYERSVGSTNFLLDLWWLWLALLLAVGLAFWLARKKKHVHLLDARCKSAFGDVDALLSERHALIPNLVEVTKAHSSQDLAVLDRLLDAHRHALGSTGANRMRAETDVGHAVNQLVSVAGSMPELSSSREFVHLRQELVRIEEKVTAARRFYNLTVAEYDAERGGTLSGLLARLSGLADHERYDLGERRAELSEPQRIAFG